MNRNPVQVGEIYKGKVTSLQKFGVFVNIAPSRNGLVHLSQLSSTRVVQAEDVVAVNDELIVKVTEIDAAGRINLSHKEAMNDLSMNPSLEIIEYDAQGVRKKPVRENAAATNTAVNTPSESIPLPAWEPATSPWKSWSSMKIGHDLAVTALSSLRSYIRTYESELALLRNNWNYALKQNQQSYQARNQAIEAELRRKKEEYSSAYSAYIKESEEGEAQLAAIKTTCDDFLGDIPGKLGAARNAVGERIDSLQARLHNIAHLKKQEREMMIGVRDAWVAEVERDAAEKGVNARNEHLVCDAVAGLDYKENRTALNLKRHLDITAGMGRDYVQFYTQIAENSYPDAENYKCSTEVPDFVMLGKLSISLQKGVEYFADVVEAIESQLSAYIDKSQEELVVSLPYGQRLDQGISLLVRYAPHERVEVQNLIQPLLLKLFMLFPAGKLEATMIDPLELGATFPDIPKLADMPSAGRIIDTKIWSKERDIETAIGTLRQRLEDMTQSYGGDAQSRLKKEVVRVLAITDFPSGFTEAALKDLRTIIRNSASLGVAVLIWANDFELERLKEKNGSLVAEIVTGLLETKAAGNRLILQNKEYRELYLQLDDMSDALARKDKIIHTIRDAIDHAQVKVEHFHHMFYNDIENSGNWFKGDDSEISVPLGIRGAQTVIRMVLGRSGGSTEHHVLVAGQTGAGKTTLLHTMIMSTLISYAPEEVQMYLVDFKEGIEFKPYTMYRLPSLRVVAIDSEREFGLNILKELCLELETRAGIFSRKGVRDINDYNRRTDIVATLPKLLLIFDEVQELFRSEAGSDPISRESVSCLKKLILQGRAMGIHVVLACQDFNHCHGLETLFSQMAVRIAVRGSEVSAASILGNDNPGVRTLQNQPAGSAIYNGGSGAEPLNVFFQISYINQQEHTNMLSRFHSYFTGALTAERYKHLNTRVLLTHAEDDAYNCFNRLMDEGKSSLQRLAVNDDAYGLLIGQGFGKKTRFETELSATERDNLLVVGKDEKLALSLFLFSAMSLLYENLHTNHNKHRAFVYILDFSAEELMDDLCDFSHLKSRFADQIVIADVKGIDSIISKVYGIMDQRAADPALGSERIFLLAFGINRAKKLQVRKLYDDNSDTLSSLDMLQKIVVHGPQYGMNTMVWGESRDSVERIIGSRYESMFDKRIAFGLEDEDMDMLVAEGHAKGLHGSTAVYMDVEREVKNTHFRPYNIPSKDWINRYHEAYEQAASIKEGVGKQ